ncbi:MAG TPA: peptide chain release factor N(5)-glutamine methyltransferase [Clostridia bacterium]|nr:peptide chain release factor N(5)-glutamine methyltransferase [Clostridia bacterium]
MINIDGVLKKGIEILKNANNEAPVLEAGVMLCSVLKCDKAFLYSHNDHCMTREEFDFYIEQINQRASGKPLQYLTGHQEFMSLDFIVTPDVLIPRQDTEILVETVINFAQNLLNSRLPIAKSTSPELKILDIGTGSGCIAVSLAHYLKNCKVTAVDISEKALKIARLNADKAGVADRIRFLQSNVLEQLEKDQYDIILSNPPYIPASDIKKLQIEVKDYEPIGALDGGADGLDFYCKIVSEAPGFLKPDCLLAFEVGYDQAQMVGRLMGQCFDDIQIIKDLSGIDRVVTGKLLNVK